MSVKGLHWIDLGPWPTALAVTSDHKAYDKFHKGRCCDWQPFPRPEHGLCTHMTHENGQSFFIIALGKFKDPIERAASLAHEATHAMRWVLEFVGEKEPGTETQAYLVEHIVKHGLRALVDG